MTGDNNHVQAARAALVATMQRHSEVVVLGEDVASGGPFALTRGLASRFGTDRVRNTPISEASFMGVAVGMALAGARPFVDVMFNDFITAASDQLFNHAAKLHFMSGGRYPVPLTTWTIAGAGTRWGAHHSQRLDGWFAQIPGLKVLAPASPETMFSSVSAALSDPNPVVVLADRGLLYDRTALPELGGGSDPSCWRPRVVREGSDVTVVSTGRLVHVALRAAERAEASLEVIDLQCLAPLDVEAIAASVQKTSRLVLVHDEARCGALMALVQAAVTDAAFWSLDAPVMRVTAPATPVPCAATLEDAHMVGAENILLAIEEVMAA